MTSAAGRSPPSFHQDSSHITPKATKETPEPSFGLLSASPPNQFSSLCSTWKYDKLLSKWSIYMDQIKHSRDVKLGSCCSRCGFKNKTKQGWLFEHVFHGNTQPVCLSRVINIHVWRITVIIGYFYWIFLSSTGNNNVFGICQHQANSSSL